MRYRGAAHDCMGAHVDRERAVEVLRARGLDGSPDLHPHVRPDVVETAERFGSGGDEHLQSGGIHGVDVERRRADLGGERVDSGRIDVPERQPIAARGQQPRPGVADTRRTSQNQRPLRHGTGF